MQVKESGSGKEGSSRTNVNQRAYQDSEETEMTRLEAQQRALEIRQIAEDELKDALEKYAAGLRDIVKEHPGCVDYEQIGIKLQGEYKGPRAGSDNAALVTVYLLGVSVPLNIR